MLVAVQLAALLVQALEEAAAMAVAMHKLLGAAVPVDTAEMVAKVGAILPQPVPEVEAEAEVKASMLAILTMAALEAVV